MLNRLQVARWIATLVLVCPLASAQIIRLNAGSSDQYNSSGGSLEFGTAHLTSGFGVGTVNGSVHTGAYLRESIRGYNLTLGD